MRETGFNPLIWVVQAIRRKRIPGSSAALVAIGIAGAVDADGRWCFLRRTSLVQRCGETLSPSTVGRALDELVRVGLIRRLSRAQVREFFADDLAAERRSPDRLPNVLELLVPAEEFPAQALERINRVRAELGEEPITPATRPSPAPAPGATCHRAQPTVHHDHGDSSPCTTDLSLDSSPGDISPSVRRQAPPEPAAAPLLAHVPDAALNDPAADRTALERAARRVLDEGLEPGELTAVLGNATALRRPFPALMRRLRSAGDARAFLDGRLGRGVDRSGNRPGEVAGGNRPGEVTDGSRPAATIAPAPAHPFGGIPLPRAAMDDDPFARPPEFTVDAAGTAPRTCPHHLGVRNVPGGRCRVCGGPCRSVPGELLHPSPSEPSPPDAERPGTAPDLVPPFLERLLTPPDRWKRPEPEAPPPPPDQSPDRRRTVAALRRRLAENSANRPEPRTAARRSRRFPGPPETPASAPAGTPPTRIGTPS